MMTRIADILQNLLDFSNVLNESIAASWLIIAVLILRFLLRSAPKWTRVALWGLVAVRLLMPFSVESIFSLIPSTETVPREMLAMEGNQLKEAAYLEVVSNPMYTEGVTVVLEQSVDRVQGHMLDMNFLWLVGIALLASYTIISSLWLHHRVSTAVILRENIFQSENVKSPFVLGIFRPRIYVPFQIEKQALEHVVAHEQAHIQRKDHWWKPLGFLLVTIHWFNPLMWLAYVLLCRDIELACDEKVIKDLSNTRRADYMQALVSFSIDRRMIGACPLAFGEVGVKERVRSVMNYKKPAFWIVVLALIACAAAAVCFLTNPIKANETVEESSATVEMIPTTADMTGAFDGYLYVPLEGGTYRYERREASSAKVTADNLLYSFIEEAEPESVEWKVYSLKEYPELSAVIAVAGKDYAYVYEYSPARRSKPDALTKAMEDGCVLHMDGDVAAGQDTWQEFAEAAAEGKAASVQIAYYYTLDREGCSEQYYEAYKEDYPVLYRMNLTYDGDHYTLKWSEGDREYVREYQYLMHYTGDALTSYATYDSFSRYVLTNDDRVTWKDLERGMFSSQLGDYIDHYSVYIDLYENVKP